MILSASYSPRNMLVTSGLLQVDYKIPGLVFVDSDVHVLPLNYELSQS